MVTTNELLQREASSVVFDSSVDDFLEHFGKKGMKWGVRQTAKLASLDFHKTGDAKAKLDRGQKAALAIGIGMTFASIAGSR